MVQIFLFWKIKPITNARFRFFNILTPPATTKYVKKVSKSAVYKKNKKFFWFDVDFVKNVMVNLKPNERHSLNILTGLFFTGDKINHKITHFVYFLRESFFFATGFFCMPRLQLTKHAKFFDLTFFSNIAKILTEKTFFYRIFP